MPTDDLTLPGRLDLVVDPLPSRPGWAALSLANDFKMNVQATRYVQTTVAVRERLVLREVSELADPVLRKTAEEVVRLWNSESEPGPAYERWSRRMLDLNLGSLVEFAGPVAPAWIALQALGADAIRWDDVGSHFVVLRITGQGRLLAQLDQWLR